MTVAVDFLPMTSFDRSNTFLADKVAAYHTGKLNLGRMFKPWSKTSLPTRAATLVVFSTFLPLIQTVLESLRCQALHREVSCYKHKLSIASSVVFNRPQSI